MDNFTGWIAYLSDGKVVTETEPVPGERTRWQQLLQACRETDISITRISLIQHGIQLMSMPAKQCDGFFQAKEVRKNFYESMGEDGTGEVHFQGIGSIVGDLVIITWVNLGQLEHVSALITTEVRPLDSCRVHTTLS